MDKPQTGNDTTSTSTQEPGDGRRAAGDAAEGLSEPLAEEHVRTQEQRNQAWTEDGEADPRREDVQVAHEAGTPPPTLDMSDELKEKMDDVAAHPHSDAQETSRAHDGAGDLSQGVPEAGDKD